ncbi:nucleotidyl transferase AbiEii/AbiGii toxin family protein [Streptomyces acidicola]|uniref:Nucleotidyl transferase AbiEii/AbiGii toxin family protein n=1 Tax=Streptomyces acidicola TaxID=2596892 RepID=A0A5N8X6J6_9ACTN|nr:hypothetical protein [Streptomyces acidicola]MPY55070.1 hypothetical protein [Streptomyces acidicola]
MNDTDADTDTDAGRRLLLDVLAIGAPYALALSGDHAVQAHGLVEHLVEGPAPGALEVATESPEPMETITAAVRAGLEERGWRVRHRETNPLSARLIVTDPATGGDHTLDMLKETLWRPPVLTALGPALSLEDVIGTKVRALTDRGLARDLVAVHAAADLWSLTELEELGRRHALDAFDLTDLQSRLEGIEWLGDREFTRSGLDEQAIMALRQWAQSWADDIAERLLEEEALRPPPDE